MVRQLGPAALALGLSMAAADAAPGLDLEPGAAARRAEAVRSRFGYGPEHPLGSGLGGVATPRFLWVTDREQVLPAPPWSTDGAYARAFELARASFAALEPDRARILVVFTTFEDGGRSLFYVPLANDVAGLGAGDEARIFDASPGSALEGYVWMGSIDALAAAGEAWATEAFLHELAHRWCAYARVDAAGLPAVALLGRHGAHWSFFSNTDGSPMEGNAWQTGPWWRAAPVGGLRFSPLDLYLMGLLGPDEVPPIPVMLTADRVDPPWISARPETPPARRIGVEIRVEPLASAEVRIEDVIAGSGPRVPGAATSLPVSLPVAVVVLSTLRTPPTLDRLADIDRRLAGYAESFSAATNGRMHLDLSLGSAGSAPPGAPCADVDECDRTQSDRCLPLGGADRVCARSCDGDAECAGARCCDGLCGGPCPLDAADAGSLERPGFSDTPPEVRPGLIHCSNAPSGGIFFALFALIRLKAEWCAPVRARRGPSRSRRRLRKPACRSASNA